MYKNKMDEPVPKQAPTGAADAHPLPARDLSAQFRITPPNHWENSQDFRDEVMVALDTYGVVVIEKLFSEEQSQIWFRRILQWLEGLGSGLDRNDHKSWKSNNIPHGPKVGMMQSLIGHCLTVWDIREAIYPLFKLIWNDPDLLCSLDGATVFPPKAPYYHPDKDWAHLDQTALEPDLVGYQGQVVLTDTDAAFVCSPKSHLVHKQILEECGCLDASPKNAGNWCKFPSCQISTIKAIVENAGGQWQIPILAPRGSVILWRSSVVHSAKRISKEYAKCTKEWDDGWRCVVYVCQRPAAHFTKAQKKKLGKCALAGRMTNHWGLKMLPKRSGGRFVTTRHDAIERLTDDSSVLTSALAGRPLSRALVGLPPSEIPDDDPIWEELGI